MGIITWARLAVCAHKVLPKLSRSLPQTPIRPSLSSYYHHLPCSIPAYTMPRLELKQTKGNSVPRKKAAKSETAAAPGKSSVSNSKNQE